MRPFWQAMGDGIKAVWRWLWEHEAALWGTFLQAASAGLLVWVTQLGVPETITGPAGLLFAAVIARKQRTASVSQATHQREVEQALQTMPPSMGGQRLP